jgi:hypothetical protein
MWSLKRALDFRVYGLENLDSVMQKDFCNTIGPKVDMAVFLTALLNAARSGRKPNTFALGFVDQKPRVVWQE